MNISPEEIEYIEQQAFQNSLALEKVIFPKNLKRIGKWAFAGSGLKEVSFLGLLRLLGLHQQYS